MNAVRATTQEPETPSADESAEPDPTDRTFVFEGVEIRASHLGSKWLLSAGGHEVVNSHLGAATRIMFDPAFHGDTGPLLREILAWDASLRDVSAN